MDGALFCVAEGRLADEFRQCSRAWNDAAGGYVVTSGVLTDEARRFAKGCEIELIGGDQLVEMIGAQSARSETTVAPLPAREERG